MKFFLLTENFGGTGSRIRVEGFFWFENRVEGRHLLLEPSPVKFELKNHSWLGTSDA